MEPIRKTMQRNFHNFVINNLLLVAGLIMTFSGLILQMGFHMGGPSDHGHHGQEHSVAYEEMRAIDHNKIVAGFNYPDWSAIHKMIVVAFSLLIAWHIYSHWKWYQGIIRKHLMGKNIQVMILTVLFLLVAVTGFIPWGIDLSGGSGESRMFYIEIHDKITLLLILFLILHIAKRVNWYRSSYVRMKKGGKG